MDNQDFTKLFPISQEQQDLAQKVLNDFQETQLLWFSGYLAGYVSGAQKGRATVNGESKEKQETSPAISHINGNGHLNGAETEQKQITILFGTRTGNSKKAADILQHKASESGIKAVLADMNEYNPKNLKNETNLAVIVSTHGEGEPPLAAEEFYNFLHGGRAPKLENLNYSVLALGDKSYAQFCKTGADIDKKLSELGGKRITERYDCDVDFLPTAGEWVNSLLHKFGDSKPVVSKHVNGSAVSVTVSAYSKSHPFKAEILEKVKLNGKGSQKETYHFEISLKGSGLKYKPGDALGVFPVNSDSLVDSLLSLTGISGEDTVTAISTSTTLHDALKDYFEIGILSRDTIEKHNQNLKSPELSAILADTAKLSKFIYGADVYDLLKEYPFPYDAQGLVSILRSLQPRLYSISSAFEAYPDEVHVTAAALRYTQKERDKKGTCSGYLADTSNVGDKIKVFIESNEAFRLPADPSASVIMIGPGTGVAPFRAFTQYRMETGSKGKNWLFFGDQHFTTDFLYQTEWLDYKKKGLLSNLSVAFSRDQREKYYVQHKLREQSAEVIKWIDDGAFIYVCGDMKHMAKDVLSTFIDIVAEQKKLEPEQAREFVMNLRKSKRYQEDVY
jgi:sulfite reductase (NADPH) flavoprotein alpha-component